MIAIHIFYILCMFWFSLTGKNQWSVEWWKEVGKFFKVQNNYDLSYNFYSLTLVQTTSVFQRRKLLSLIVEEYLLIFIVRANAWYRQVQYFWMPAWQRTWHKKDNMYRYSEYAVNPHYRPKISIKYTSRFFLSSLLHSSLQSLCSIIHLVLILSLLFHMSSFQSFLDLLFSYLEEFIPVLFTPLLYVTLLFQSFTTW